MKILQTPLATQDLNCPVFGQEKMDIVITSAAQSNPCTKETFLQYPLLQMLLVAILELFKVFQIFKIFGYFHKANEV